MWCWEIPYCDRFCLWDKNFCANRNCLRLSGGGPRKLYLSPPCVQRSRLSSHTKLSTNRTLTYYDPTLIFKPYQTSQMIDFKGRLLLLDTTWKPNIELDTRDIQYTTSLINTKMKRASTQVTNRVSSIEKTFHKA